MSTEDNKTVVRRVIDDFWNNWNWELASELFAPDYADHTNADGQSRGLDGLRHVFVAWQAAFPNWHITVDAMYADGDAVVTRLHASGTHAGGYRGIAPTGRRVHVTAIEVFRVVEGKVVELWANMDELGLLRQLGAMSSIAEATG